MPSGEISSSNHKEQLPYTDKGAGEPKYIMDVLGSESSKT